MRILTFSTLYPNAARPGHGPFVEHRLRQLVGSGAVSASVIAPVPWFPFRNKAFGDYADFAAAPRAETRHGLEIVHPRYPVVPKVGMNLAPALLERFSRTAVDRELARHPDTALIDAHYFYPDGVAAAAHGLRTGKPVVITARGTDISLIPQYRRPRQKILWAARQAAAIITVCEALKLALVDLGVPADRITVLRNGVDFEIFRPVPKQQARARTLMNGRTLLSVGHMIERKGHHLVIEALTRLPDTNLVIVGDGPMHQELVTQVASARLGDRVRFAGRIAQDQLPDYYSAADALLLASSREGMANVLLESLACGTPVVATPVWGTPEVIADPAAGVLSADRSAGAIAAAVRQLFDNYPDSDATLAYARQFSWEATTAGQIELFRRISGH
ncbi:MAG: glycosyltransferase family 4 protein [Gammaproteobacteria bacterium]|nr:glycosyltransferase family 4 protein [Gammaproteobacteria bacterium]NNF59920.1 glycosyltransferase family 4 protein [Gammaproteobacteria bacterium]NNM21654.1 glycosyltransferase family 4 protein [Gammaproteobacteria bacterium]